MTKQKRELYEGMYILSASLSEDARKKSLEKITSGISESEGEIHKIHEQGRKKLAYEINGKREGYYYVVYFTAPTSCISKLWRDYHLNEDLIRFTTLRTESIMEEIKFKPLVQQ
jgi:small subunit ribosomal protein S6